MNYSKELLNQKKEEFIVAQRNYEYSAATVQHYTQLLNRHLTWRDDARCPLIKAIKQNEIDVKRYLLQMHNLKNEIEELEGLNFNRSKLFEGKCWN